MHKAQLLACNIPPSLRVDNGAPPSAAAPCITTCNTHSWLRVLVCSSDSRRLFHFADVGMEGRKIVPLFKKIGIFVAVSLGLNCLLVGLYITANATYDLIASGSEEDDSIMKIAIGGWRLLANETKC